MTTIHKEFLELATQCDHLSNSLLWKKKIHTHQTFVSHKVDLTYKYAYIVQLCVDKIPRPRPVQRIYFPRTSPLYNKYNVIWNPIYSSLNITFMKTPLLTYWQKKTHSIRNVLLQKFKLLIRCICIYKNNP